MKVKKIFSTVTAVTLAMSMGISASAAGSTGSTAVTGEGETVYMDTEIFDVILPTSANLDFTLDPLGLTGITEGNSEELGNLTQGLIVSEAIAGAVNRSSVDIELSVGLKVTGDATVVATEAASKGDTNNNVALFVRPSLANVDDTAIDTLTKAGATLADGDAGAFALDENGFVLNFLLGKGEYKATNTGGVYTYDYTAGTGKGTAITIEGFVNPNADWKEYMGDTATKKVGLDAVFSFEKADPATNTYLAGADLQDATPADIVGLKKAASGTVTMPVVTYGFVSGTGMSGISNSTYNYKDTDYAGVANFKYTRGQSNAADGNVKIPFATDGHTITNIYFGEVSQTAGFADVTSTFTISANEIQFKEGWDDTAAGNMELYIVLDNGDVFCVNLKVLG